MEIPRILLALRPAGLYRPIHRGFIARRTRANYAVAVFKRRAPPANARPLLAALCTGGEPREAAGGVGIRGEDFCEGCGWREVRGDGWQGGGGVGGGEVVGWFFGRMDVLDFLRSVVRRCE